MLGARKMPGPLIDCYVLAPERSAKLAMAFLDRFVPDRDPSFDPNEPSEVLGLPKGTFLDDVLSFLETNKDSEYRMYWSNSEKQEPYHALLAFNADSSLVLGLSPCVDDKESTAIEYLKLMKDFAGTNSSIWGVEMPPPASCEEFFAVKKAIAERHTTRQ
jgi:hypothetical protein